MVLVTLLLVFYVIINWLDDGSKALIMSIVAFVLCLIIYGGVWVYLSNKQFNVVEKENADFKYVDSSELYYYDEGELKSLDLSGLFVEKECHLCDNGRYVNLYIDDKPLWVNFLFFVPDCKKIDIHISDIDEYHYYKEGF